MGRKYKQLKPLIYVFCEGESEQAYADFLKKEFSDVAVIKRPGTTGIFEEAEDKFEKDPKYRNSAEVTDEIWFFFDVELKDTLKWDNRFRIITALRKLRTRPNIKVRLLMTTGCIEYWLMLHYEMLAPQIQTEAQKIDMRHRLQKREPTYEKGDYPSTAKIAQSYPFAVENAKRTVSNLIDDGLPCLEDTDKRNQWLYTQCKTFSTVYEAIEFLEGLSAKE